MEYMGNQSFWDKKFEARDMRLMGHEKKLEEDLSHFKAGSRILDFACGDGRNTIFLAKLGYLLSAVDFSEKAIARLQYFSDKNCIPIDMSCADLRNVESISKMDCFDGIIINHYRVDGNIYKELEKHILPGGLLWVNGFCKIPESNPNVKKQDLLSEEDFLDLTSMQLEDKKQYEIMNCSFCRYIYRKR